MILRIILFAFILVQFIPVCSLIWEIYFKPLTEKKKNGKI